MDEFDSYQAGVEDTCDKLIELIWGSNFEITPQEIVTFLETEKGWTLEDEDELA